MPVYLFLAGGGSVLAADTYSSETWNTDLEWGSWDLSNIELNGSDSGIRLKQEGSGYATSGEATYKFTPGGNNRWVRATAEGDNAGSISSKYAWVPIYRGESVSQIDTKTGEIVKEWGVGGGPSRTAIGCNNDVWVANNWGHSISHIISAENKVITRPLEGSVPMKTLTSPRAISVLCGSGTGSDSVFVGASRYLIKFSAQEFDSLSEGGAVVDVQEGNTLTISAGNRSIIGSAISADVNDSVDSGNRYIYVALDGGVGAQIANRPNYKIDANDLAHIEAGWPKSLGYNVIVGDNLGNVWKDGVCGRFYAVDDSTKMLCSNSVPASGVSVIPDHPNGGDKLAYLQFHNTSFNPLLHVANLNNNNTANPTISGIIETTYSGANHIGAVVRGGALDYDDDYDIWYLPNDAFWIAEFKESENYSTAHKIDPTQEVSSEVSLVHGYSDFIGDSVSPNDPQTLIEYSVDGSSYYQANSDGSFPSEIADSQDLYIKVKMTGFGTNSPLLKSLKVEYEPESQANLQIVRKIYASVLDRDSDSSETTFEKNETAYVRLILFQPGASKDNAVVVDRLSNFENPREYRFKQGCSGTGTVLTPSLGINEIRFNLDIPSGLSCLDYEYTVK
jgi:hypothetical protein